MSNWPSNHVLQLKSLEQLNGFKCMIMTSYKNVQAMEVSQCTFVGLIYHDKSTHSSMTGNREALLLRICPFLQMFSHSKIQMEGDGWRQFDSNPEAMIFTSKILFISAGHIKGV